MNKPLVIDLFCGLGGLTEGLLAEGWRVIGFDIEPHVYGEHRYPAQLVIQDVRTLHGSQFRNAELIVASPPCQEFSYMAMPWSKAKAKQAAIEADTIGIERARLTALFDACFRIQREACEAAGRHIPLIVENVRGAQKWVGRARWNYGSFYLWGDVPALMPMTKAVKIPGFRFDESGRSFQTASVQAHIGKKVPSQSGCRTDLGKGARFTSRDCGVEKLDGTKLGGSWFHGYAKSQGPRDHGSKSSARKMASAMIAKIPFPLSRYIAKTFYPKNQKICE